MLIFPIKINDSITLLQIMSERVIMTVGNLKIPIL